MIEAILKEADKEIKKPAIRGCRICSKRNTKVFEKGYYKVFYRGHDGKMPRLEVEDNGNKYEIPIKYCPECGCKIY